jgi:two-component system sensor histidine kinase VicK
MLSHVFKFEPIDPAYVDADKDKIIQVVENFLTNAVKYSPARSIIQLTCVNDGTQVVVSVRDEGMGLSELDCRQVFDRFYRVQNEQAATISGFGIGLYICKEIIDRHGGRIGVDSTEGVGSTFWFSLPLAKSV